MFPLLFFLLVSIRQYILPKLFDPNHLQELDASEYEEIAGAPKRNLSLSLKVPFFCFFFFNLSWSFIILNTIIKIYYYYYFFKYFLEFCYLKYDY